MKPAIYPLTAMDVLFVIAVIGLFLPPLAALILLVILAVWYVLNQPMRYRAGDRPRWSRR